MLGNNVICPENEIPGYDDEMRIKFMEKQNEYRASLARGEVEMKNGRARPASKMRELERYNCDAEKSAYELAKKCLPTISSSGKYDENLYVLDDANDVLKAVDSWWSEVSKLEMDQKATRNSYNSSYGIPNLANMAWDSHKEVGCAIATCSTGKTHVACHYGPKVKEEGKQIYKMGPTCRRCHDYEEGGAFGSCYNGLCVIPS
ncbi:SCP-like protein [Ancylostoma caninum]|uniref:SCP-like protein n=1 Tax=Ancylostoma caninum TaxID=29170 RepID=A0A368H4T2_ANCCA|nr:SCP-like protein [Ancylostoma caninum]